MLFDDDELGVLNLEMVRVLRDECGYGVKFAGSGGACVGAGVDDCAEACARSSAAQSQAAGFRVARSRAAGPHRGGSNDGRDRRRRQ